jgi:hypothetical protein
MYVHEETVNEGEGDYSVRDHTEERDGEYEKGSIHVDKYVHVRFLETFDGSVFSHGAFEAND